MAVNQDPLDILAIGAHADDVEIGMAGTLAKFTSTGYKAAICDLTLANLSSNGTVENRKIEADAAANILDISERINLGIHDRGIRLEEEQIGKVVSVIRRFRPKLLFIPYEVDRHPDHGWCTKLVEEAAFSSGIRRYQDPNGLPPHKVHAIYYYFINGFHKPSFCVDITDTMDKKIKSLLAYESQFSRQGVDSVQTPLTNGYIESVEARERMMGKEVGVTFAEGFISKTPLLLGTNGMGL
ncbi:bacillithiol biosynthesis deacetylase BshB1 [Bacillus carboniphilus]|uniref:Bacillithiol biosynthesis deacetylase BshB1 n=1 Tax=Bacillus carboniphilus TaxID=86663 RepID=A0ABN0WVF7_9BACI